MYIAQEDEDEESSLVMVLADEHADVLLLGINSSPIDDMWYRDTRASIHLTGIKIFYQSLDESHKGVVRFGDGSSIRYEGKGEVHMECTNGERMIFENVLYMSGASFPKATEFRASKPLELVYADICGPIRPSTISGGKYFLLIFNDFSRLMWVTILKNKSEAFGAFKKFNTLAESESNGALIKCLRINHGGEFTYEEFSNWCEEKGIQRQLTTTYTPQKME